MIRVAGECLHRLFSFERARKRARAEEGVVLILVAVALIILVAFVALGVDVGYMYAARASLQSTADSAALAGASGLPFGPAEARARAMEYAQKNNVYQNTVALKPTDIELGHWDPITRTFAVFAAKDEPAADSVRVTGNLTSDRGTPLALLFGGAVGLSKSDVRAQSIAIGGASTPWDVVLLQDITASFNTDLPTAVEADRDLLACLEGSVGSDSRAGIAVHTGWGLQLSSLVPLGSQYASLMATLNGLKPCGSKGMPVCSGTDTAAGMQAAINVFTASSANPDPKVKRAIILVSDGQPQPNSNGSHPTASAAQLQTLSLQQADIAAGMGISIFTIYYDDAHDPAGAVFLQKMIRGIGTFQNTPNPKDLSALLAQVCGAISSGSRLVQ